MFHLPGLNTTIHVRPQLIFFRPDHLDPALAAGGDAPSGNPEEEQRVMHRIQEELQSRWVRSAKNPKQ